MSLEIATHYVELIFDKCPEHSQRYGFREKYSHTKRVVAWTKKLLKTEQADHDILLYAATFHDVGYTISSAEHPKYSAEICKKYLSDNGFDAIFTERVVECILNHDNKELLYDDKTSKEVILLIEADCLDESGAMSILRDALSEGLSGDTSYNKTYQRLLERRIVLQPNDFFCVTETAKKIWQEKQKLYYDFVASLKIDLGE
jgi:HD superfamily phosphodiesterase